MPLAAQGSEWLTATSRIRQRVTPGMVLCADFSQRIVEGDCTVVVHGEELAAWLVVGRGGLRRSTCLASRTLSERRGNPWTDGPLGGLGGVACPWIGASFRAVCSKTRRDSGSGRLAQAAALSPPSRFTYAADLRSLRASTVLRSRCAAHGRCGPSIEINYGWPQVLRIPGGLSDHVVRCWRPAAGQAAPLMG